MEATTVARNYGDVLFELAEKHGAHEEYATALDDLVALLEQEPRLRTFLETPKLSSDEKKRVLREVLAERVPRPFLNFLMIVIDKRRQRLLPIMAEEYRKRVDVKFNRLDVEVVLASEQSERVHDPAEECLAHRDVEHAIGAAHCVAFVQRGPVAHDDGADVVFLEIERERRDRLARLGRGDLEHLARHRVGQAVDAGHAVLHLEDLADLLDLQVGLIAVDLRKEDVPDLARAQLRL